MDHHGDGLVRVKVGVVGGGGQTLQGLLGVFVAALADQPPRRLGSKGNQDKQRHGPHPLQAVRDAICPLVVAVEHGEQDANANLLAETPAKVDIGGQVAAQSNRADLGGVGDGQSLEDAPGDAAEDLGSQQSLDVGRGEEQGDECGNEEEAAEHRLAVSDAL